MNHPRRKQRWVFATIAFSQHTELVDMPPVIERYEQLVLPVLRLVATLLAELPRNQDVVAQVIDFVDAHYELISMLLKDRSTG